MEERPLRRDAERNRRHLLASARDLMARDGLGVTYEQIARAAGMGMGTIYRRFPQRDELLDALFADHVDAVVELAAEAAGLDDAWEGLVRFLTRQLEVESRSRALGELLRGGGQAPHLVQRGRDRITPHVVDLVRRAVADGQLDASVTYQDVAMAHLMVGAVLDVSRGRDDLWRRALETALAGLRSVRHLDPLVDDDVLDHLYSTPNADPSPEPHPEESP